MKNLYSRAIVVVKEERSSVELKARKMNETQPQAFATKPTPSCLNCSWSRGTWRGEEINEIRNWTYSFTYSRKSRLKLKPGRTILQTTLGKLRSGTRTFSYFFWNSKLMNLSNSSSSWTYFFLSSVSFTGTRDIKFISYFPWPDMTGSGTTEWNPSRNPICPDLFLYDRTDPILLKEVI